MAAVDTTSLHHVCYSYPFNPYIFLHKSHVASPYISLSSIHLPIPPFSPVSLFITPCLHLSIRTLSAVLELPPTAINPFNPPISQSVPQPRSYPVSWPFTHRLTSEIWPLIHPSFSLHPPIYPPIASLMSSNQGKDVSLLIPNRDFFFSLNYHKIKKKIKNPNKPKQTPNFSFSVSYQWFNERWPAKSYQILMTIFAGKDVFLKQ